MSYVLIFSHVARRYMIQFACLEVVHILILSRPNWEGGGIQPAANLSLNNIFFSW